MVVELISVGTELLMGQITNTDARFLAEQMKDLGFDLHHQSTVGDNYERLTELLKLAFSRADIIITTGGLGPTEDDMTKECVTKFLGLECALDQESYASMEERMKSRGRKVTPSQKKQAVFPAGSRILPNPNGTAPGCMIEKDGKTIVILPGPPREMNPMFLDYVFPALQKYSDSVIVAEFVQIFGIGEAQVEYGIRDLIEGQSNPTIATYVKPGSVSVRVAAKAQNKAAAQKLIDPTVAEIAMRFSENIYEIGQRTYPQIIGEYLMQQGLTLSVSESCTGGLLADAFVKISGVSSIFDLGVISYGKDAKEKVLGVKNSTLESFGAVSEQTAKEMAQGVRSLGNTDIGLSTTGLAGPGGDGSGKPVGLVYIGLATKEETIVEELNLHGDRENIRTMSVLHVMDMIRRYYKVK